MNRYLSSLSLIDVRRSINQSLTNTFQMMFHLDIFLLPEIPNHDDSQIINSYMELSYQEDRGILTVALSRGLAEYLAHQLDPSAMHPSEAVTQDIVCEINNIVGNHLRSYIQKKIGIELDMHLPRPGIPPRDVEHVPAINLHFRIREHDNLDLGFSYAPPTRQAVG